MKIKKLSKTIVTALAITVLGISGLGLTAYTHEGHDGEATPIEVYRLFNPNGQKRGELDMLIYDKTKNEYGNRKNVSVLYRGNPFKSSDGVNYINLNKFIRSLDITQDVKKNHRYTNKGA